jgi:hypothetical protein
MHAIAGPAPGVRAPAPRRLGVPTARGVAAPSLGQQGPQQRQQHQSTAIQQANVAGDRRRPLRPARAAGTAEKGEGGVN